MTTASLIVLAGAFGFLVTGVLAYRLSSDILGRLWTILAVVGVLLFGWGQYQGGTSGLYAVALVLILVLPLFVGTLIAGLIKAWSERGTTPEESDPQGVAEAAGVTPDAGDPAQTTGDRGIDLLRRRMNS
jgi:hypothetical protein